MSDSSPQKQSRSYILPVEDTEFLLRAEMRDVRFELEYAKAELLLRDWGVRSTIMVFGSARTPSPEQVAAATAAARPTRTASRRTIFIAVRAIRRLPASLRGSPRSAAAHSRPITAGATT